MSNDLSLKTVRVTSETSWFFLHRINLPLSLSPLFSCLLELIYSAIFGQSGHSFDQLSSKSNPLSSLHWPPLHEIDGNF